MNLRGPVVVVGILAACSARGEQTAAPPPPPSHAIDAAASITLDAALPWYARFDFDGDGRNDEIDSEYTRGGHCCYRFSVRLTTGGEMSLPFFMDGGYVGTEDLLSNPHQLAIRISDAGVAEMWMEIETYNGEPRPLDPEWISRWGFSSHRVVIGFLGGKLTIRDQ